MATKKPQMPRYGSIFRGNDERSEMAKIIWRETISALDEANALTAVNLSRADRYTRARVEYEDLYPGAAEAGPVKVGPNGGDVFAFEWSAVEKLNERMMKLERAMFGEAIVKPAAEKPPEKNVPADEFLSRLRPHQ